MIYLIGSLRSPRVPEVAKQLRAAGIEVFDDWYAAGPEADDYWQKYENARGRTCAAALAGHAAQHVFGFDKKFLDAADEVVLVLPAGKSGHLELGYALGRGKPGYIILDGEPDRYDVMYNFATGVFTSVAELLKVLQPEDLRDYHIEPPPVNMRGAMQRVVDHLAAADDEPAVLGAGLGSGNQNFDLDIPF